MGITRIRICYADGAAETRFLPEGTYLIGRGTGAIPLDDPNVSTRHAELEVKGDRVIVRDLGSRNGSRDPKGQRLTGPYTMKPGEVISLGKCTISVTNASLPPETRVMDTREGGAIVIRDGAGRRPPPNSPTQVQPEPPPKSRSPGQIFISHVAEDSLAALRLALLLEQAGYTSWVYELDSMAGVPHLDNTAKAIEQAQAFVLLCSQDCVHSHEVMAEITRAHDSRTKLIPLLYRIPYDELQRRRPEWAQRFPGTVGVDISDLELGVERLVMSLEHVGVKAANGVRPDPRRLQQVEREIKRLESMQRPPTQGEHRLPGVDTLMRDLPRGLVMFLIKFLRLLRRLADALKA